MFKVNVKFVTGDVAVYIVDSRGDVNAPGDTLFVNAIDKTAIIPLKSVFAVEIEEVQV